MRKTFGWVILVLGFLLLGFILNQLFAKKSQPLSPIPNTDEVKVIMLTPAPTATRE